MSLVVFTALRRAHGGARPAASGHRLHRTALHRGRRRRRRRAQHVVRRRYRRAHDAHRRRGRSRAGGSRPAKRWASAMTLAAFSVGHAGLLVNVVAAALLAATIAFYVVVYTMWLKRRTPQNIVIGGAAGALPPVIGWAAATGSNTPRAGRCCSSSSSSGRRRISGRSRSIVPTNMRAPACRCCRSSPAPRETRLQILRLHADPRAARSLRRGFSAIPGRFTAQWRRWAARHDRACASSAQ